MGPGSAVPDPRAESPDAARAGDPARWAGPPISEQIQTARRERRVPARVCRAAWRLEQAGRERAWATGLSPRRGSADPYSGRRAAGQEGPVCRHEHAVKFRK